MAIYFFDKNQTLIKIVPESATFEAIQTQELDDDSLLKDTLSVTIKGDEKLLNAEYMAVKSYKGNAQTFDMYRIVTDTTPDKSMSFTGMSLAPYELNGHIIQDLRPANHSLSYTLNRVLDGTDWRVGYIDDGLSNVTTTFYYVSAKEALKELQSLVGCEFVFKVEISGQKITDKWIEVYSEMGNRTKKRFNYGTNALTVVRETNKADIFTALIGRGKGEEVSSADDNESGQAGYGRKITFEDIEWKKSSGKPLDKPKGQYYLELPQATQAYGIKNIDGTMKARVGIVDFDDEEDKNRLINLTYQQLLVSSRPKVLFKTTVANVGATGIGDTVTIHRHDLNIHYQTRVRKIVRNKLNDNKTQIELGDAVVTASTKQTKRNNATIKNLNNEIDKIKANVTTSQNSADGKNTIFYGSAEPERQRTGDTWYRPHPSIAGETQMLTWNGTAWELVLDTSDLTSVSREVRDAIDLSEEAKSLAISEAENALALAKADATAKANAIKEQITGEVNTAITTAEDAKSLAVSEAENALAQAKADATAKANAVKEEVSNSVNTAIETANTAKQTAVDNYNNAITEAARLDDVQKTTFNTKFGEIEDDVSAFNESVSNVDAKANSALEKAGANANLLTIHQNTLNTINTITLPDISSTAGTALANAKSAIDDAKLVDGKVDTFKTEVGNTISTVSDSAKAAMDEAKKADGKISDYVTKNGLISGTTVDTKINDATGEISRKITTVESRIDGLQVGGRNLVKGTSDEFKSVEFYTWNYYVEKNVPVKGGTYYTLSARVIKEYQNQGLFIFEYNDEGVLTENYQINLWYRPEHSDIKNSLTIKTKPDTVGVHVGFRNNQNGTNRFKYREFQFEQGTIATDWTPSPEDLLGQEEFKIFENTYSEDVKGINSKLVTVENNISDTNNAFTTFKENEYKRTAERVSDTFTKSETNTLVGSKADKTQLTNYLAKSVYEQDAEQSKLRFETIETNKADTTYVNSEVKNSADAIKTTLTSYVKSEDLTGLATETYATNIAVSEAGKVKNELTKYAKTTDLTGLASETYATNMAISEAGKVSNELTKYAKSTDLTGLATEEYAQTQATTEAGKVEQKLTAYAKTTDLTGLATETYATNKAINEAGKVSSELTKYELKTGVDSKISTASSALRTETAEKLKTVYTKTETETLLGNKADNSALNNYVQQATYESGIDGVKEIITSVRGNLGSPNLLKKSWHNDVDNPPIVNTNYNIINWELDKPLVVGKTYTFRLFGFTNREYFLLSTTNAALPLVYGMTNTSDTVIRRENTYNGLSNRPVWEKTFTLTQAQADNMTSNLVRLYNYPQSNTNNGEVYWATLVEGRAGINWSPALSETMGKADFQIFETAYTKNDEAIKSRLTAIDSSEEGSVVTRLNKTEKTASGNTTTISDIKTKPGEQITGYQTIKERSDLYERVLGSTDETGVKSNISRHVQASGIIQSEVASAVPNPNLLSGTDFKEGLGDVLVYNRAPTLSEASYFPYGKVATIQTPESSGTANVGFAVKIPKKDTWYTLSFYGLANWVGSKGVGFYSEYMKSSKNYKAPTLNGSPSRHRIQITVQVTIDNAWLFVSPQGNTFGAYANIVYYGVKLEVGEIATPWENSDPASSSKITQLADNINLKVSNEKLLSEINVQAGGVLIQSGTNKLNITPETTFIKDATIKSAMIDTVNVKQLTGITADFTSMVTKALTANTITSTMINANDAMFTKLFATKFATDKLVAQGAWITNANIVSIDAGTIKSGTIDSARIDAEYIVTNGLSTDVVESTHIKSSTGLIDKIFANEALITRLTSNSIFASKIKAIEIDASKITSGELAAARIKSKDVVTAGLSANVVEATHIKAEAGLVGKLFSTTAYIEELTNKTVFTEKIQAINISADKVTTGTLDAGKVKVVNIDAENITANKTSFIQSNWNDISSSIRIDAGGLLSTASDGSQVYLQNGVMGVRRPQTDGGGSIGQIGYVYDGGSPTYTIRTTWGSHFGLKQVFYDNFTKGTKEKRVMYASTADDGVTTVQFYANDFILHQRKINFGFAHYINGADSNLSITGQTSITLRANESTIFIVSNNGTNNFATLHANLNMAGNVLTNTSDIRLKRNIVNDEIDSLSALMKWQHAGFNYINPDMNQDRQYGVIAQSAPDLSTIGEDGYLQVSLNKQVNMTSHALQQHVIKTNDKVEQLEAKIASLQDELALLKGA